MDIIRRLVFVCTGNTCRSPMAAALARREAERRSLSVEIESCGTGARPGDRATHEAVDSCAEAGLDISHHSATNMSDVLDDEDTVYVVMSMQHASWLRFVLGIPGERVFVLGDGVPDPFGGSLEVYRRTFRYLESAIKQFFDRIESNLAAVDDNNAAYTEAVFEYGIYKAEGENAPAISMLENRTFTDSWSLSLLADEIDNPDAIFLIASDKRSDVPDADKRTRPVYGYAIALITADIAQLLKLSVDEHVRRKGVAEALLTAMLEKAAARGCTEITLEARVSNAPAISLYEKAGFRSLGVRPNFYSDPKEDAMIMSRSLDPDDPAVHPVSESEAAVVPEEAPADNETVPAEYEETPTEHEEAAADYDEAPAEYEETPTEHEETAADYDEAPAEYEETPTEHEEAPSDNGAAPAEQETPDSNGIEAPDKSTGVPPSDSEYDDENDMILLMPDDDEELPDIEEMPDNSTEVPPVESTEVPVESTEVPSESTGVLPDDGDPEYESDMILLMPDDDE